MTDVMDVSMVTEGAGGDIPAHTPQGRPASCAVSRARSRLEEELRYLASIEEELSTRPGTKPERHPDFWLGLLRGTAAYLLWTLREQDKAVFGGSDEG